MLFAFFKSCYSFCLGCNLSVIITSRISFQHYSVHTCFLLTQLPDGCVSFVIVLLFARLQLLLLCLVNVYVY